MRKLVAEVDAEIAAAKAAGEAPMGAKMRKLRAERAQSVGYEDGTLNEDGTPKTPPSVTETSSLAAPVAPALASNDVAFVNEALAKLTLEGKAGKPERCYSDVRSALAVKHIIEDAAGLVPSGRIALPHWDTLGRDRDTGLPFKPGENQLVVDGLAQRAIPPSRAATVAKPTITTRDGAPLRLPRTRLDEPDGTAEFVTAVEASES